MPRHRSLSVDLWPSVGSGVPVAMRVRKETSSRAWVQPGCGLFSVPLSITEEMRSVSRNMKPRRSLASWFDVMEEACLYSSTLCCALRGPSGVYQASVGR